MVAQLLSLSAEGQGLGLGVGSYDGDEREGEETSRHDRRAMSAYLPDPPIKREEDIVYPTNTAAATAGSSHHRTKTAYF